MNETDAEVYFAALNRAATAEKKVAELTEALEAANKDAEALDALVIFAYEFLDYLIFEPDKWYAAHEAHLARIEKEKNG